MAELNSGILHTEKSFRNLIKSNLNQIVFAMHSPSYNSFFSQGIGGGGEMVLPPGYDLVFIIHFYCSLREKYSGIILFKTETFLP